jgi:hypothetical protein
VRSKSRMGISEMTDSILMLASFERTDDVLENAAMHSMVDRVRENNNNLLTNVRFQACRSVSLWERRSPLGLVVLVFYLSRSSPSAQRDQPFSAPISLYP